MPSDPPGGALLARMVRAATARPVLTIALSLALAAVGALYTAKALTFQTSAVQLLPPDRLYVQRFQQALQEFGELNDIVVVVQAPSLPRAQDYADRLAADIRALPGAGRVAHRIDPDLFKGQALLYLSTERLAELRDKIVEHRAFIQAYAANPSLDQLFAGLSEEIARRIALGFIDLGIGGDAAPRFDPGFVQTLLDVIGEGLDGEPAASPWARVLTAAGDDRSGYFLSGDKTLLFIFVEPRRDAASFTDNEQFLDAIRRAIGALRAGYPDVAAGVTGTPALSNDEMVTAFHDSTWAGAVAFALTLALLLAVFRRVVEPLVLLAVLQVSLAWSMGIITAVVGHLSIFSVMFISILIGIGIDYGIYEFFRYEEELGLRRSPREALHVMATRTGPGLLFGALTAAGTFGVLMLTDFRGIQEFGFIAGLSILVAFLAMFTLLPAVLILLRRRATRRVAALPAVVRAAHESAPGLERVLAHSRPILLVSALLTAYALSAIPAVQFDYNRLNLQARGTESVVWERRITESAGSGFAALATAGSLPELRDRQRAFERLPAVSDVMSVLALIPGDQDAKIAIVRDISPELSSVRYGQAAGVDPAKLRAALATLRDRLALGMREAEPGPTADALRAAHDRATALIGRLDAGGADLPARLARLQATLGADFGEKLRRLQDNLSPSPVSMAELPDELKRKFVGRTGQFLMRVSPAIDTWDQAGAREFVTQLRTVDPAVTGPPVISYEASRLMEAAYFWGTLYAFALVVVLTASVLRRVRETLLVLVPVVLGTLWTIGFMHLFGLSFNLANVWGLPLIIGASAEYGLNVAVRYREAAVNGGASLPRGHVVSVLLNGLTTVAGFGSLLVARHQGIFGLGLLLTVGTAAALAASLILLPVLLRAWCPAASAEIDRVAAARGVRE
jgi:hopanoid biosynthesis associated RND transporter like protein HpnN